MTVKEVKMILGEPENIRLTVDSLLNYCYIRKSGLFEKRFTTISLDKLGCVKAAYYENPE